MVACSRQPALQDSSSPASQTQTPLFTSETQFTQRDWQSDYDPTAATLLTLPQKGETVTVSKEGVYLLQGQGKGQILVDAPQTEKIQLILNGVTLHNETSAPIYVKQANKVFLTLEKDSVNTLSCGEALVQTDENTVDGVIFAKDDLTLNGEGALNLTAPACHGIVAKDDLAITAGEFSLITAGHGISANNSLRIGGGWFTLNCQKDGLKVEHEDSSLGYIYMQQATLEGTTLWDGVSASGACQIDTATCSLTTGGGATASSENSCKGIKAGGDLVVYGGSFTLNSCDDALHTNQNATIRGGTFTLSSGDDGVHADGNLVVEQGEITVSQSYEALEGHTITLLGGTHSLTAYDDGLNSAGGADQSGFGGRGGDQFAVDEEAFICIQGGKLTVNAGGDGLDSNGTITVRGGETYVYGPVNGGNGAIDGNGTKEINGGILVAVGTYEMAENFDTATQGTALVSINGQGGAPLTLENEKGEVLISCTPTKAYQCAVVSCPQMEQGETYVLKTDTQTTEFTLTDIIYGQGMGMGTPGGNPGGHFGGGGRPGGGQPPGGFGGW